MKKIMQERYSCRNYLPKKISDEDIRNLVDLTRLSPSSMGLEPWKFMVVGGEKLDELSQICNNQNHVKTCSHALIIITRTDLKSSDPYLRAMVEAKGKDSEKVEKYIKMIAQKTDNMSESELRHYSDLQGYLACANLVNIAHSMGIRSCIVAGFDYERLLNFIDMGENFHPCIVVTLGYSDEIIPTKIRRNLDEVLVYKN